MASPDETQAQVWTATYWQHHCRYDEEFDTVRQAWRFLDKGEGQSTLAAVSITSPDGSVRRFAGREMTEADFGPDSDGN